MTGDARPKPDRDRALWDLLGRLEAAGYDFVMPTLATHGHVARRRDRARAGNLRDVFGWTRAFAPGDLAADLLDLARRADAVRVGEDGLWTMSVRASRIDGRLCLHSARNDAEGAVFLGPDSYRFVRLIAETLQDGAPVRRAFDIGTGAGAGALAVAARRPGAQVHGGDVNPQALRLLAINAGHAGLDVVPVHGPALEAVDGAFDLIVANPPYIAGRGGRLYRDGGDRHGSALALNWVRTGLRRLTPGGRFVLYTGAPVVDGVDVVRAALGPMAGDGLALDYQELDPDVFGDMLRRPEYADVERIAAVGAVLTRRC